MIAGTRPDMPETSPSRYVGLGDGEKHVSRAATALAFAAFAVLILSSGGDLPVPRDPATPSLQTFDLPLPPPPRIAAPAEAADEPAASPAPARTTSGGAAGPRKEPATQPAPVKSVTIDAALPTPLFSPDASAASSTTSPGPAIDTGGHGGTGTGSGSGAGAGGTGDGPGGGGGEVRYAQAAWIDRPSPADMRRNWPAGIRRLEAPVSVLLVCAVRRSGRPHGCKILREGLPGRGFGKAGVRLVERARVRPVLRDGRSTDLPVLIPLTFMPDRG